MESCNELDRLNAIYARDHEVLRLQIVHEVRNLVITIVMSHIKREIQKPKQPFKLKSRLFVIDDAYFPYEVGGEIYYASDSKDDDV